MIGLASSILIVALSLFTLFVPYQGRYRSLPRTAFMESQALTKACRMYFSQVGEYPKSLDSLFKKPDSLTLEEWDGPYIDKPIQNDPWDRAYVLEFNETKKSVTVRSFGADRIRDTEDDILSVVSPKPAG